MRYISSILFTLIFSTSSFATACLSDPNTFRKFMNRLVVEQAYFGNQTNIDSPSSGTTTITSRPGVIGFEQYPNRYIVYSGRCSDDGQCEILKEETWQFLKGCLYVNGTVTRMINLTNTLLRFDYDLDGSTYRARYEHLSSRRLGANVSRLAPEGVFIQGFLGRGI